MGKKPQMTCPSMKRCYATRGAAEQARKRIGGQGRAYRCGCGYYHVTAAAHAGGRSGEHRRRKQKDRTWRG